jgi:hypothetical protein
MRSFMCGSNYRKTPAAFGDPQFTLRHMGLNMYFRLHSVLAVTYAIDEARGIVYVRNVRLFVPRADD